MLILTRSYRAFNVSKWMQILPYM